MVLHAHRVRHVGSARFEKADDRGPAAVGAVRRVRCPGRAQDASAGLEQVESGESGGIVEPVDGTTLASPPRGTGHPSSTSTAPTPACRPGTVIAKLGSE